MVVPCKIRSLKFFIVIIGVSTVFFLLLGYAQILITDEKPSSQIIDRDLDRNVNFEDVHQKYVLEKYNQETVRNRMIRDKIKRLTNSRNLNNQHETEKEQLQDEKNKNRTLNPNIQILYQAPVKWYKIIEAEKNTEDKVIQRIFENSSVTFKGTPELNIAFYPQRKLYNSTDEILREHFSEIRKCGIGVVVLAWTPAIGESLIQSIFHLANEHNLKISIQMDDYIDRTIESVRKNVKYFIDHFNKSLVHFNVVSKNKNLPIFYIKNSFSIDDNDWKKLLSRNGMLTIRGTVYDSIMIGHISNSDHKSFIRRSNFDGFYPYLPSNGATYSSTWKNWVYLKKFSDLYKLIFIPTIGPGFYDKTKYKKNKNQHHSITNIKRYRSNGQYYDVGFRTALKNNLQIITINSYNNWVDGTQIEAAIPVNGFRDYLPGDPEKYVELTGQWVDEYKKYKMNALKNKSDGNLGCYDFINNTIC